MLLYLLLLIFEFYYGATNPVVETRLGKILGTTIKGYGDKTFSSFEGIPFAKPPIGRRRFAEPEPIRPWRGTLKANVSVKCLQLDIQNEYQPIGEEDCLVLNIYVPRENPNPKEKLEVFVYLPGGAFQFGSGTDVRPDFFMEKDIIFISVNYRLNIFGFLSTEDDVVPGNNGLKDQVLALKWVQKHISNFGGNPGSVTLFGGSAGSISLHFHYFSEMSKGLFHRGYGVSGVALIPAALTEGSLEKAKIVANALKCPTNNTRVLVECLRRAASRKIASKLRLLFTYEYLPLVPLGPVIEKGGSRPFLKTHPYYKLIKGEVLDVPFVTGNDKHEGLLVVGALVRDLDYVNNNWNYLAPISLDYNYTLPKSQWNNTSEKIRNYYFGNASISLLNVFQLIQLYSDRHVFHDTETALKLQANRTKSSVYYYLFTYPGDNNPLKLVPHGAEGKYLSYVANATYSQNDLKMKDLLLDMLVTYAKTNKPTFKGVDWKPTRSDEIVYLNVNGVEPGEIKEETRKRFENSEFWDSLHFAENANLFPNLTINQ